MPPRIIGISGTNGSGKDTAGTILARGHSYLFVSVTDILRAELKKRGQSFARENMRALSSEWRKAYGLGVLVDKAKEIYDISKDKYSGLALASLRNPGEADSVHGYGGIVLWLDADPKVRYERVVRSDRGVHRAVDDNKSYAEFLADEAAELRHPNEGDQTTLSMLGVKAKSDLFLTNNSNDLEEFKSKLDRLLGFSR